MTLSAVNTRISNCEYATWSWSTSGCYVRMCIHVSVCISVIWDSALFPLFLIPPHPLQSPRHTRSKENSFKRPTVSLC